jgi:hypothetical protein
LTVTAIVAAVTGDVPRAIEVGVATLGTLRPTN